MTVLNLEGFWCPLYCVGLNIVRIARLFALSLLFASAAFPT